MSQTFNARFQLRRDNDYNYKRIANTFVPLKGEICLIDTVKGLKVVCGDGKTTFGELEYLNNFIIKGYYNDPFFYEEAEFETLINPHSTALYIDLKTNKIYFYEGDKYYCVNNIPTATSTTAGVVKLYTTTGSNEDGTMTQKAITDELNEKVEVSINLDEELLIFTN